MTEEQIGTLVELAKNKCKISWSKEQTNKQITGIVEDAVPVIAHLLGIKEEDESDLLSPGLTRGLFLEYCLYRWSNQANEFTVNYRREILIQRHRYEVKYGKEETEELQ